MTYLDFVRLPWGDVVATYTTANNQVFYTVLAKAAVSLFGSAAWVLRLPAFMAGVLTVPAVYAIARTWYDGRVALVATMFVATSGMLILYSTNGRGYSLVVLAFLLLLLAATRILDGTGGRPYAAFAVIGAFGLWAVPIMLYPLGAVALWLVFVAWIGGKPNVIRQTLLAGVAAMAFALVLYSPVIVRQGIAPFTAALSDTPSGWFTFFQTLPASLMDAVLSWTAGVPFLSVVLALLAISSLRRPSRFPVKFGIAAFCWCAWLLLLTHRTPPPRAWLWIYPVIAVSAALQMVTALEGRQRTRALVDRLGLSVAVFAVVLAIRVLASRAVPTSTETGSFRDARAVVAELAPNLGSGDVILAAIPSNGPLSYYFDQAGVRPPAIRPDSASRVFVIVDVAEGQTLDMLTTGSVVRDTTRFVLPRIVRTFTTSGIFLYQRRHATSR